MPLPARLRQLYRKLHRLEKAFLVTLAAYLAYDLVWPVSINPLGVPMYFLGAWLVARLLRYGLRKALWRLRNRLVICYMLIGVVPVVLIAVLVGIGLWILTGQTAVYLVTTSLDERESFLVGPARGLLALPPVERIARLRWMAPYFQQRFPGLEFLVRDRNEFRYPPQTTIRAPNPGWKQESGLVLRQGRVYLLVYVRSSDAEATFLAPVTRDVLSRLVPGLGDVSLLVPRNGVLRNNSGGKIRKSFELAGQEMEAVAEDPELARRDRLPPAAHWFDIAVSWPSVVSVADWENPGKSVPALLLVQSRPSAVLRILFDQKAELGRNLQTVFVIVFAAFLVVELISLIIGISLSRTITGAVHNLYTGTQKVMEGNFSHRIEVRGDDQLAHLGQSFNRMTEHVERLLAVAKEKERMQAELEIAREVQNQLFPKHPPALKTLDILARCNPARMVSGDYYDYQSLQDSKVALAFGDVAGKGISAALLMATVQSAFRTQIRACLDAAASPLSSSRLVGQLNQQLHAHSSPEKFSTFYFGIYDDRTGVLTYTNAGHLPPMLVRRGEVLRLEINGMVVGAFPFAEYGETRVQLESGDVLVCFTDGITEPENEYGEMFGEDRLMEVLLRNTHRDSTEMIDAVMKSVHDWTGSPELQDDMTLLVARRI
jgi:phosphoserine phosphatase RsbU/P